MCIESDMDNFTSQEEVAVLSKGNGDCPLWASARLRPTSPGSLKQDDHNNQQQTFARLRNAFINKVPVWT